ncbi:hypothetical protein DEA8626_02587 [Defluviimonas aquaemixtae]|uniref:DUF2157 domain-containing protein n=1 Tax=Albidovulum aquaemixtae TaxID=1542388 RepID=A0A2R8BJI2_9RHOB|nr:hypothetical protein [Defluviimonas aquaemixtae]SPH23523.1 hypothetical protein DEA8626_02587 [Defluviimonas aquaemixtae]
MPDDQTAFGADDLRAAVAAGIVTEAQAAGITALAHDRAGRRASLPAEDEPFEFFRGFAEIFIAIGLAILLGGVALLLSIIGGITILIAIPAMIAAMAWWMARYFTLNRRMNLPSMVLVSAYSSGIYVSALTFLSQSSLGLKGIAFAASIISVGATALWFRRFKLPFSMFVLGLFALMAIYALFTHYRPGSDLTNVDNWALTFLPQADLSLASLVFGIGAFVGAMWFDLRDRYRIGRHAATAFWLHILAGAALVNTVAGNLYGGGGGANILPTALALLGFALVALIIDRRSMLTAGIVYIAALIYWAVAGDGTASLKDWAVILIILGAFFTLLGTWWVQLRAALMRALPDFPGKSRLPPWYGVGPTD